MPNDTPTPAPPDPARIVATLRQTVAEWKKSPTALSLPIMQVEHILDGHVTTANWPTPAPSLAERLTDEVLLDVVRAVHIQGVFNTWADFNRASLNAMRAVLVAALSPEPTPSAETPTPQRPCPECHGTGTIQDWYEPPTYTLEQAERLAALWGIGKMVAGDQDAVIATLFEEIHRLRREAR